jgi:hypothetical protein
LDPAGGASPDTTHPQSTGEGVGVGQPISAAVGRPGGPRAARPGKAWANHQARVKHVPPERRCPFVEVLLDKIAQTAPSALVVLAQITRLHVHGERLVRGNQGLVAEVTLSPGDLRRVGEGYSALQHQL